MGKKFHFNPPYLPTPSTADNTPFHIDTLTFNQVIDESCGLRAILCH